MGAHRRQAGDQGWPGANPGDVVYVEPAKLGVPAASGAGNIRAPWWSRIPGPGACSRWSAALLRPEPVQPRHAGAAPAGSSFKPIVYAAALDNGYTPSTLVLDAPIESQGPGSPFGSRKLRKQFYGPSTLRFGIEHSRNVMTVRLAPRVRHAAQSPNTPSRSASVRSADYLLVVSRSAPARPRCCAWSPPTPCSMNGGRRVKPT